MKIKSTHAGWILAAALLTLTGCSNIVSRGDSVSPSIRDPNMKVVSGWIANNVVTCGVGVDGKWNGYARIAGKPDDMGRSTIMIREGDRMVREDYAITSSSNGARQMWQTSSVDISELRLDPALVDPYELPFADNEYRAFYYGNRTAIAGCPVIISHLGPDAGHTSSAKTGSVVERNLPDALPANEMSGASATRGATVVQEEQAAQQLANESAQDRVETLFGGGSAALDILHPIRPNSITPMTSSDGKKYLHATGKSPEGAELEVVMPDTGGGVYSVNLPLTEKKTIFVLRDDNRSIIVRQIKKAINNHRIQYEENWTVGSPDITANVRDLDNPEDKGEAVKSKLIPATMKQMLDTVKDTFAFIKAVYNTPKNGHAPKYKKG